jgi:hypothetical protein
VIERYAVVAGRIRQELSELAQVVARAERAMAAVYRADEDADLLVDAVALNLHDFYAGLERVLGQIATLIDRSMPSGRDWHRELLRQMTTDIAGLRPGVMSAETAKLLDEYLRFRHVVRNIYAFEFDREQIDRLVRELRPVYTRTHAEMLAFAEFLDRLANE